MLIYIINAPNLNHKVSGGWNREEDGLFKYIFRGFRKNNYIKFDPDRPESLGINREQKFHFICIDI